MKPKNSNFIPEKVLDLRRNQPVYEVAPSKWALLGSGRSKNDCGEWRANASISEDFKWIKRIKDGCRSRECPIDWPRYIQRQIVAVENRFWTFNKTVNHLNKSLKAQGKQQIILGNLRHVVISPPQIVARGLMQTEEGFTALKRQMNYRQDQCGIIAGVSVFHAHRWHDKKDCSKANGLYGVCHACDQGIEYGKWYDSPHWHILGYGYIKNTEGIFDKSGWFIKNIGDRDNVYGVIWYLLSHAAYWSQNPKRFQSLAYLGLLSMQKLKKEEVERALTIGLSPDSVNMHRYTTSNPADPLIGEDGKLRKPVSDLPKYRVGPYYVKLRLNEWFIDGFKIKYRAPWMPNQAAVTIESRLQDLEERFEPRFSTKWWVESCEPLEKPKKRRK